MSTLSHQVLDLINSFLNSSRWHDLLAIIKGLRNGVVYGAKIRFPHALVMTFLFGSASLKEKIRAIFKATYQHSKNLAMFVVGYKTLMLLFSKIESKQQGYHSFVTGFLVGYYVWGENNKINEQINLYVLSRALYGLVKLAAEKGYIKKPESNPFPWFAAITWGLCLWMFENYKRHLQPSMQSSMTYLYHDSNVWHNLRDFLLYNT